MSNTYLDRKNSDVPYLFISYSHADKDDVERLLTALNEKGADFWYDKELYAGDDWREKVTQATENKNCAGVIYLISSEFVHSSACREEFEMQDSLKAMHDKFDVATVLLSDDGTKPKFSQFINQASLALLQKYPSETDLLVKLAEFGKKFNEYGSLTCKFATKQNIDDESFVDELFEETFKRWGCASEEVGVIDALLRAQLASDNYRVKTESHIAFDKVRDRGVEWKIFAYNGNVISAILVSDELYTETCLSLAKDTLNGIADNINMTGAATKHLRFDEKFLSCLKRDGNGRVLRFLKASEREKYYLQLREALEKVPVADATDDGYFFVEDYTGRVMFADRGSSDVYKYIHVDAYASIFPVIDIDYEKYKSYVLETNKA